MAPRAQVYRDPSFDRLRREFRHPSAECASKGPGDQITYAIVMQLAQAGFTENQLAEGNGEALTTYSDALVINELMGVVGVKSRRTIDQQRVPWDLRDTAKGRLRDWYAKRYSVEFFNQVCGYTPQTDVRYTGLNAVTAPSATRIIRQSGRASDDLLTSADTFTLGLIDAAKELAITASPMIRPIQYKGTSMREGGRRLQQHAGGYVLHVPASLSGHGDAPEHLDGAVAGSAEGRLYGPQAGDRQPDLLGRHRHLQRRDPAPGLRRHERRLGRRRRRCRPSSARFCSVRRRR
jgi:hypothetical protein